MQSQTSLDKFNKLSLLLLQYLIVEEQKISPTQIKYEIGSCNIDDSDDGFNEIWKHITLHWYLDPPKLIISVIDDTSVYLTNKPFLQSVLLDLVKAAATAKGEHFYTHRLCVLCTKVAV